MHRPGERPPTAQPDPSAGLGLESTHNRTRVFVGHDHVGVGALALARAHDLSQMRVGTRQTSGEPDVVGAPAHHDRVEVVLTRLHPHRIEERRRQRLGIVREQRVDVVALGGERLGRSPTTRDEAVERGGHEVGELSHGTSNHYTRSGLRQM